MVATRVGVGFGPDILRGVDPRGEGPDKRVKQLQLKLIDLFILRDLTRSHQSGY